MLIRAITATALVAACGGAAPTCEDGRIADAWGPEARARVEAAFGRSQLGYAKTSLASVLAALDARREAWVAAYAETCKAPSELRTACLDRRRQELASLVASLAIGERDDIREGVAAVAALPPVAACSDALQDIVQPAIDPAARTQVDATVAELVRCRTLLATGRHQAASKCAENAAARATELGHRPLVAEAELLAGAAATRLRDLSAADAALRRGLVAAEASRDARARAQVLVLLVSVDGERGDFTRGTERVAQARAALGDDLGDLAFHAGVLALRQGKLDDAVAALTESVAAREKRSGPKDASVAEALVALGNVHTTRRKYDEARAVLDRALEIQKAALGAEHPAIGKTLHVLAQLQARLGDIDGALASQRRSYDLLVAAYGEHHRDVALSAGVAAQVLMFAGRPLEAEPYARQSVELMGKALGADHLDTAVVLQTLATIESRTGNFDAALAAHQRTLAIREHSLPPDHPSTQQSQINVALALRIKHRCTEALPLLDKVIDARTHQLGPHHLDTLRPMITRAGCRIDVDRPKDAIADLELIVPIVEAAPMKSSDDRALRASCRFELARALWDGAGPRPRASKLARAAHTEYVELKDTRRARETVVWMDNRKIRLDPTAPKSTPPARDARGR